MAAWLDRNFCAEPELLKRWILRSSSLHQKIENLAFIVDRAPQPELLAANQHGHLVEMSPRSRPMAPRAKLPGEQRLEFQ